MTFFAGRSATTDHIDVILSFVLQTTLAQGLGNFICTIQVPVAAPSKVMPLENLNSVTLLSRIFRLRDAGFSVIFFQNTRHESIRKLNYDQTNEDKGTDLHSVNFLVDFAVPANIDDNRTSPSRNQARRSSATFVVALERR